MPSCPTCEGRKYLATHINTGTDSSKHYWIKTACSTCLGSGGITDEHAERIQRGRKMREERLARLESLKEAATRLGMTPSQLSAIERGEQ